MPSIQNTSSTLSFLETLGTGDRGDNLSLNNTGKALVRLAEFLITKASDNLQKKGNVATGDTISSMKIVNLNLKGTVLGLDVQILRTYKFLDQGVKGVEGGTGKYQFKSKHPSKKMALAILKWMRKRGAGGRIKYKAVSKNEAKNQQVNAVQSQKNIAYAISTKIKKKGIRPTKFFSNAVRDTRREYKKEFAKAFKLDIIETIKRN